MRSIAVATSIFGAFLTFCGAVGATDYPGDTILYGTETFTLRDGDWASEIFALESSTVYVQGGEAGLLGSYGSSTTYVTGGNISSLPTADSATVYISAGSVNYLGTSADSDVFISGGEVHDLFMAYQSEVHLGGGTVSLSYDDRGMYTLYMHVHHPAVCHFDGTYLSGYWYGGTPFPDPMNYFQIPMGQDAYDHVVFLVEPIPVPEPATALLLATGLVLAPRLKIKKKTA